MAATAASPAATVIGANAAKPGQAPPAASPPLPRAISAAARSTFSGCRAEGERERSPASASVPPTKASSSKMEEAPCAFGGEEERRPRRSPPRTKVRSATGRRLR